jgi:hypothetical protein
MSDENKWQKTPESPPNLEGTDIGKVLDGLKQLQSHYESQLQENLGHLAALEQGIAKWELQKKKRKVDPNG